MGIIENIKGVADIVRGAGNMDLYRRILDLQAEALDLTARLRERDQKIEQLEEAFALKGTLKLLHHVYYVADADGNLVDGPFCTKCYDVDKTKCRMVPMGGGQVQCQRCKLPFRNHGLTFLNSE